MKKLISIFLTGILMFTLASCGGTGTENTDGTQTALVSSETFSVEEVVEENVEENEPETDKLQNPLTGLYDLDKSAEGKRFYSLMIGNSNEAMPQLGVSEADLVYEMMVEGGITRMMAIYADIEKCGDTPIGSNRSARTNFVSTALGYDCIFGHYSGSESGYRMIRNNDVDDLDGLYLAETFWRDSERQSTLGKEHSALTNSDELIKAAEKKGYRTTRNDPSYTAFTFNTDGDISANGSTSAATEITAKFSSYMTSTFEYDSATGMYKKLRNSKSHIDGNTNEQLTYKNVIVITDKHGYESDKLHVVVEQESGTGYYFCDGKAVEITWSKGDVKNPYKYMTADGSDLLLTPGKTYVCVVPSNKGKVSYS